MRNNKDSRDVGSEDLHLKCLYSSSHGHPVFSQSRKGAALFGYIIGHLLVHICNGWNHYALKGRVHGCGFSSFSAFYRME